MPSFRLEGQRIAYTEFGGGPAALNSAGARGRTARSAPAATRPVILVHGLLLSQQMHWPLAEDLAARGNRVITVDLLGHGESSRPRDMWRYSMQIFGEQVVALMDHLQLEQSVVMGTSLGANTALEIASAHPERLRGMVVEMPVLDNALLWSALAFTPLLVALTFGEPAMRGLARGARAVPRRLLRREQFELVDGHARARGRRRATDPQQHEAMGSRGAGERDAQTLLAVDHRAAQPRPSGIRDRGGRARPVGAVDLDRHPGGRCDERERPHPLWRGQIDQHPPRPVGRAGPSAAGRPPGGCVALGRPPRGARV